MKSRGWRLGLATVGVGVALAVIGSCTGFSAPRGAGTGPTATATATATEPSAVPGDDVSGPYPVSKVVDGDTIWVERAGRPVKVRLIGIDTPEVHDPRKPVQCFGQEATAAAESLLAGKQVLLESDPSQASIDRYGRDLAYVWVDGVLANLVLIQGGYAHEYTYDVPYRYQTLFRAAQQHAEQDGLGLWSPTSCAGDTSRAAGG